MAGYAVTTIGALGDVVPLARANPTRYYDCANWTANVPPRNIGDPTTPTPSTSAPLDAWLVTGIAVGGALLGAGLTLFLRRRR